MKKLIVVLLSMSLSGCALIPWLADDSITVNKKAQERSALALPDPQPLKPGNVEWIVVTPENVNQVWARLRAQHADLVLFALTDDGYEALSMDSAATRNFIQQQRELLIRYRQYYEPGKKEGAK